MYVLDVKLETLFPYVKVVFKGVYVTWTCFLDGCSR